MILGLDVSTSITGVAVVDNNGELVHSEVWDLRKYKNFFTKAQIIREKIESFPIKPERVFIEQSLQSFRSGFHQQKLCQLSLDLMELFRGFVIGTLQWSQIMWQQHLQERCVVSKYLVA